MNCNVCGKEFEEKDLILKTTDDGAEYYICNDCETNGVVLDQTVEYYICKKCGYPHRKDEFKNVCKFCEQTGDFEKLELTAVEEDLLNDNPQKFYKEKLGDDIAANIAQWIESPEREEVGIRHKRDRIIDTSSLVGILLGYFLLETSMGSYAGNKVILLVLLTLTVLTIIASPVFKIIDRKPRNKPLPLWLIYIVFALIVDAYIVVLKFFA